MSDGFEDLIENYINIAERVMNGEVSAKDAKEATRKANKILQQARKASQAGD